MKQYSRMGACLCTFSRRLSRMTITPVANLAKDGMDFSARVTLE